MSVSEQLAPGRPGPRRPAAVLPVEFCGLRLAHPVINASGTFDLPAAAEVFGDNLLAAFPFSAFVSKTITLAPRAGNPPPRLWEAPGGLINSIGLPNRGLAGYLESDLPRLAELLARTAGAPLITNLMGASGEELAALVEPLDERPEVAGFELNVSCPNVKTGLDLGSDPDELAAALRLVRPRTSKPLIVKLTPNAADVPGVALAAEAAGADAVSLINTLRAMALNPRPGGGAWLGAGTGGLSGPAVRTVALAQVAAVAARVSIPVVGMGGVQRAEHARDLLEVGAKLVAVGTESFRDPATGARIAAELQTMSAKSGFLPPLDA
jgi:dihydroorotate dehydrogenase (NAD+) catalytic subunit